MQSFYIALSVSVPLIVYMTIGMLIRRFGIFSRDQFTALNGMLFRVFIPILVFMEVYRADLAGVFRADLFFFVIAGILLATSISFITSGFITNDRASRATVCQGCYRSNFVLFGTIVATSLSNDRGVALIAALSSVVIPLFAVISVFVFERTRDGKIDPRHLLKMIVTNPLVIGVATGILFSVLGIKIPSLVITPLSGIVSATTPVALVTLGGIISFSSIRQHLSLLTFTVFMRLILIPVIAITVAITLMHFRGNELIAILAVFAGPTSVSSSPTAQSMGGNGPLSAEIVAITSTLCVITLFVFVFFMSYTGLI